jgi:hypothetical protein
MLESKNFDHLREVYLRKRIGFEDYAERRTVKDLTDERIH